VMAIKPVLTHDKTALAPRIISLERARAWRRIVGGQANLHLSNIATVCGFTFRGSERTDPFFSSVTVRWLHWYFITVHRHKLLFVMSFSGCQQSRQRQQVQHR
jgi:hypothetical protein